MRPVWFIIAAICLIMPIFGIWNIFFGGFQVSGMWEYVVILGMLLVGIILIILGFVQKNGVYVTGTMIKKTNSTIQNSSQGALPKDYVQQVSTHDPRIIPLKENSRTKVLMDLDLQNNFMRFSWQQAEDLVGKLFEKKGYSVTIGVPTLDGGTKRQGDFGIDVDAKNETEHLGIQVKHWTMDVGFEDVAKTLGVAQKFNKVIMVSTKSGFTSQAWEHAQNNPYLIELWDSNKFKNELRQHVINSTNIQKSKGALPKNTKNESLDELFKSG